MNSNAVFELLTFDEVNESAAPLEFAWAFRNKRRRDIGDLMASTLERRGVKLQKTTLDDYGVTTAVSLFE